MSFRVFGIAARNIDVTANEPTACEIHRPFRVRSRRRSTRIGSCARFAVGPLPRLCGFSSDGNDWRQLSCQPRPLFELGLSLAFCPATPSLAPQREAPLMDFCSLQHIQALQIGWFVGVPCPRLSARRVWPPSRRFALCKTGSAISQTDSAPGIRRSELCSANRVA